MGNYKDKELHAVNHPISMPRDLDNFIEWFRTKTNPKRNYSSAIQEILRNSKEFKQYLKEL